VLLATQNSSMRSLTLRAAAASVGMLSFAIACPSGSGARLALASLAARRRR
jgi:hypothetical protein